MDPSEVLELVNELLSVERDTLGAYQAALEHVEVQSIYARLAAFAREHELRIEQLSSRVVELGGLPRERPNVTGVLLRGLAAFSARMGPEAALRALQSRERLSASVYADIARRPLPQEEAALVRRFSRAEAFHAAYLEDALLHRIWEQESAAP